MTTLHMPVGLPGSGKTTFLTALQAPVHFISPDSHLMLLGKYLWSPERASEAWAVSYRQLIQLLLRKDGLDIVFDACFLTRMDRTAVLNVALGANIHVAAYYFPTSLEMCIARNERRAQDREVPAAKLNDMARRLQAPAQTEGFTSITTVTLVNGEQKVSTVYSHYSGPRCICDSCQWQL